MASTAPGPSSSCAGGWRIRRTDVASGRVVCLAGVEPAASPFQAGLSTDDLQAERAMRSRVESKPEETGMPATDSSRLNRPVHPVPACVRAALRARKLTRVFHGRPAHQQNGYVGWITDAKLPATQQKRLEQMLDE